jgi:hypothetical protein
MSSKGYPADITVIFDGNDRLRSHRGKGKVDYRHWIGEKGAAGKETGGPVVTISIAAGVILALFFLIWAARKRVPKGVGTQA